MTVEKDPQRIVYQGLAFAAAAALVGGLAYWMLSPGSGPDEFRRASEALRNARSWRIEFTGTSADHMVLTGEVACPRVHMVVRRLTPPSEAFAYQEFLVIDDDRFFRESADAEWRRVEDSWGLENLCAQARGGGGNPRFMPDYPDLLRTSAQIEKGDYKTIGGVECRVWKATHLLKAQDFQNEEICFGVKDHLPRERVTSAGRFLYSNWNEMIEIPLPDRVRLISP